LTICKQIVELHGGRMWLESKLGAGTTFFFQLPISPPVHHVTWPGHWIREDWIWREHGFRTGRAGSVDGLTKPRVIVCDGTGRLYSEFVRSSDEVEFVDVRDLDQARRALRDCPAHVVVLNADAPAEVWPAVETVRREAPETPIIGCSVSRPAAQAPGSGARGHLTKPVTRGDLEEAIRSAGWPVRRVLAVDDDPHVLRLLARMLHTCDPALKVTTVSSGEEALDQLRRAPPDLLLLDIVMPGMDGQQVLACMAGDERIGDVPVFLVSAQDPQDQPLTSPFLLAAKNEGLSISTLLQCSLEFSAHLLKPDPAPR
jgi:CheY-like chemotaxis protein